MILLYILYIVNRVNFIILLSILFSLQITSDISADTLITKNGDELRGLVRSENETTVVFDIYEEILNADVFINVPVAKHHMDAKLTLAMKNLMGIISDRPIIHKNFGQRIADLASAVRPTLNVMDAVRVMKKNGPIGYFLKDTVSMDTIIVSEDMVAIDSYTTSLFDMKPEDLDYVVCAAEMGIGRSDIENLLVEEYDLS